MRHLGIIAALSVGLSFAVAGGALAASAPVCKDTAGKVVACPSTPAKAAKAPKASKAPKPAKTTMAAPATKPIACRDAKGQITKCPTAPAAKPVAAAKPAAAAPAARMASAKPARAPRGTKTASAASTIPTHPVAGAPSGATAKCKDGSFSMAKSHAGSCAGHGGVANWI
ncbi:MAG: DUF3761 domain-containing protein [Caulobacteraceae bacterium]